MFYIKEYNSPGSNRGDDKLFYVEYESEMAPGIMPDLENDGDITHAADGSQVTVKKLKVGDQALVLESANLYVLKSDNTWQPL